MAVPMRTQVDPCKIASLKSPDIPIDNSHQSTWGISRRKSVCNLRIISKHSPTLPQSGPGKATVIKPRGLRRGKVVTNFANSTVWLGAKPCLVSSPEVLTSISTSRYLSNSSRRLFNIRATFSVLNAWNSSAISAVFLALFDCSGPISDHLTSRSANWLRLASNY